MYESLVAEYIDYELPYFVRRRDDLGHLPTPERRNIIHSIIGVRRCGKTFRLFQLMSDLMRDGFDRRKLFYFPFDDDRLGEPDEQTASKVLDAYYKLVPEALDGCYLFFDEIQEMPRWEAFVRRVSEQDKVTLVITGSSSKLLSTDIHTKLRGRSLPLEMWPLSFAEYCDFNGIDATSIGGSFAPRTAGALSVAFERYLDCGGFPAVQELDKVVRSRILQGYAEEIMTKDVLERFGNASYRVGRRFALSALRSTGLKFSVNKQVKTMRSFGLTLSNESAYALLDDFEDAHLAFKVADYHLSVKANPKSAYKIYSVDPGLSFAVAPAGRLDLGQRLETAVFVELMRRNGANRDNVIARYSTPACPEVDFVVGDCLLDKAYNLIQVAAESGMTGPDYAEGNAKKAKSELGNLEVAMGETGLQESTLITLDEEADVRMGTGTVRIVPAWKWCLSTAD